MRIQPVILSGGAGTRLWPVSRSGYPKQLQALCSDKTLLQETARRLPPGDVIAQPMVICNADQRFIVAEQLREVGIEQPRIVLEPAGRSTAPAIAVAALLSEPQDETVLVILPADQYIPDEPAFREAVTKAAGLAAQGRLMTFGVHPSSPHTGYGYIRAGEACEGDVGALLLAEFKEKPNLETAKGYVASGQYFWNSGMFVFRADRYLAELQRLQPDMLTACREAVARGRQDLDFLRLDGDSFGRCSDLSVDYAVMEHVQDAGVLPVSFAWNDVGGWPALWELGEKDERGNVLQGDVIASNISNCYIRGDHRLIAAIGLEDILVVETPDALLVADIHQAEKVKEIVAHLKREGRTEEHSHERIWRPWGYYQTLDMAERFQVKLIMVKPEGKLSLQMHHHRAEHWVIVSGTAKVTRGEEVALLGPNESTYISMGTAHRLENPGKVPLFVIEVQSGEYLGEDDIVRFEDIYRRAG